MRKYIISFFTLLIAGIVTLALGKETAFAMSMMRFPSMLPQYKQTKYFFYKFQPNGFKNYNTPYYSSYNRQANPNTSLEVPFNFSAYNMNNLSNLLRKIQLTNTNNNTNINTNANNNTNINFQTQSQTINP